MDYRSKRQHELVDEAVKPDRRTAESEVQGKREHQTEYREVWNTYMQSPIPTLVLGKEGRIVHYNNAMMKLTGYTHEEVPNIDSWMHKIYPDEEYRKEVIRTSRRSRHNGMGVRTDEFFITRKNGEKRYVEFSAYDVVLGEKEAAFQIVQGEDITERKQAEQRLRRSEASLAEAQRIAHLGSWDWNIQTDELTWSDEIYRIFGLLPQEFGATYEAFLNSVHPRDRKFVRKSVDEVLYEKKPYSIDHRIVRRDGSERVVHESAKIIFDKTGKPIRMVGTVQDITQRKATEGKLRRYQEHLEKLVEERTHDFGERVKELNCLYGIARLVERPGISLKEIFVGTVDLIPPSWQYPATTCARVRVENKTYKTKNFKETSWRQSSDIVVYRNRIGILEVYYLDERPEEDEGPFLKEERNLIDAIAQRLGRIIERQKAEELLRGSEERYRNLYEGSHDGYARVRMDGKIVESNRAFREMTGYSAEELRKLTYQDLTPKKWHEMEAKLVKEIVKTGYTPVFQKEYMKKDGSTIPVELRKHLLRDQEGKPGGIWEFIRDISERKRIESLIREQNERLKELDRMKSEFLSTAAHELRTPLNSILCFSEILLTKKVDQERRSRYLKVIHEGAHGLTRLMDQLLDVSRIESGRGLKMRKVPVQLKKLILQNVDTFEFQTDKHDFEVDVPTGLPLVNADTDRINQVMENLIGNAVKFSPLGGTITVGAKQLYTEVQISVADKGMGISRNDLTHIFERFYRADNALTETAPGVGLGLAITKHLVESHGGRIWAESEVGIGSTFHFTLPLGTGTDNRGEKTL